MMRKLLSLLAVPFFSLLVNCGAPTGSVQSAVTTCAIPLQYTVTSGPNAGKEFNGVIGMKVGADGSFSEGKYVLVHDQTKAEFPLTGRADGKTLNLSMDLGAAGTIAGSGSGTSDFRDCRTSGGFEGPGTGPSTGDVGNWAVCCCGDGCPVDAPPCRRCAPPPTPDPDYCSACMRTTHDCRGVFCP